MLVKLFVTKSCNNKSTYMDAFREVLSLGSVRKPNAGECGNTLAVWLEIDREDVPTAIKLLTENGFKAVYA